MCQPQVNPDRSASIRKGVSPACTTKLAKYRPAASRITVTDDGSEGRSRDQRTLMSPIFGNRSWPPGRILNRALAVNLIACRPS